MSDERTNKLKALVELMSLDPEVSEEDLAGLKAALPWADITTLKWLALELHQVAHRASTAFESKFIPQRMALNWADAVHLEKELRKALTVAIAEVIKWIESEVREDELIPFEERWDLKTHSGSADRTS